MHIKTEEKVDKYIEETNHKISMLKDIRSYIRSYSFNYNAKLQYTDINEELKKQEEILKKLKALKKNAYDLCIDEKKCNIDDIILRILESSLFTK